MSLKSKTGHLDQIIYADPHKIILNKGGKEESNKNPFQQARDYCNALMDRIKEDQYLLSKEPEHFGKLRVPIYSGVVFPNINKYEFQNKFKDKITKTSLMWTKSFSGTIFNRSLLSAMILPVVVSRKHFLRNSPHFFRFI